MRVTHLSYSDSDGGAARAAYRLHRALRRSSVDSRMVVQVSGSGDWTVSAPSTRYGISMTHIRPFLAKTARLNFETGNATVHSPALLSGVRASSLNASAADVVHLHWIQGEMISISQLARINKPVVWTLHDMWAFLGAEHYSTGQRWREGYLRSNRPDDEAGFDLNRWTWERKRRLWKTSRHIIAPSHWMADCVRNSALMRDWPVSIVPNPIDTDVWKPVDRDLARSLYGLPPDKPLLLFGAMDGASDPRKGFDLFRRALRETKGKVPGLQLAVFGQRAPAQADDLGFPVHYMGHLGDDLSLCLLYCAADAFVLPSRIDNLPNTGVESLACGTPVIAFDTGGMADIVRHRQTGYLAGRSDASDLAQGIQWAVNAPPDEKKRVAAACRDFAVERFAYPVVTDAVKSVYLQVTEAAARFG